MENDKLLQLRDLLLELGQEIGSGKLDKMPSLYGVAMDRALCLDTASIVGAYWNWKEGEMPMPSVSIPQ